MNIINMNEFELNIFLIFNLRNVIANGFKEMF